MGLVLAFNKGNAQPSFTVGAAITGTVESGQTLTCTYTVVRAKASNVTVRWYSHANIGGTPLLIGTGATVVLTGTEVGQYIRAIVTAINPAGTVSSTSDYTAAVAANAPPLPPTVASAAVITGTTNVDGTANVGDTLTVTASFNNADTVTYQWYSFLTEPTGNPLVPDANTVELGTANTQALTASEAGRWIGVNVTGTNAVNTAVTSAKVAMAGVDAWTPALPDEYVPAAYDDSELTPIYVNAGDDLQYYLDTVNPGEKLVLKAGETWTGQFSFSRGDANGDWIYIVSSNVGDLPAEGSRVSASDAAHMPKIRSTPTNATHIPFRISRAAKKVRFVGIEFEDSWQGTTTYSYATLQIGEGGSGRAQDVVIDRCYIHGQAEPYNAINQDGILTQFVDNLAVVGCRIEHYKRGIESHGIHARMGKRMTFENNYISAASICFFISDNATDQEPPQDIVCRGNHLHRPLYWYPSHPTYNGLSGNVKNLWEIKGGYRVLAEGNLLENNWVGGQDGPAVLITPRALEVTDVTFRRNFMKNCQAGFNINTSGHFIHRVLIEHNIYSDSLIASRTNQKVKFSSNYSGALRYVTVRNNTMTGPGENGAAIYYSGSTSQVHYAWHLRVFDNIFEAKIANPTVGGNGYAYRSAIDRYFDPYAFRNNAYWSPVFSSGFGTEDETEGAIWINHYKPANEAAVGFDNKHPGATADHTTGVWTLAGHPFTNGLGIRIASRSGGTGLSNNTSYWVGDVSGDTFKLYTTRYGSTEVAFTTDVTDATLSAFTSISSFILAADSPHYAGNAQDGTDGQSLGADVSLVLAALNDDPFA